MLKLRGVPDLEESNLLVRLEHRVYAPWQAVAEGHKLVVGAATMPPVGA
jgi:hypothetical protein